MIEMKRVVILILGLLLMGSTAFAQTKTKIQEGLYIVNYAGTYVIEDEINQRSISIEVTQERIDDRNSEALYNVVCGKWTKRVVKTGLNFAIKEGIKHAATTGGSTLMISAIGTLTQWIYDDACEYWEKKNRERANRYNN